MQLEKSVKNYSPTVGQLYVILAVIADLVLIINAIHHW